MRNSDIVGGVSKRRQFNLTRCSTSTTTAKIDYMSTMPDEILVCILSLLTVKQAGVTSVLSSRWRDVWKSIVTLSFDFADISGKLSRKRRGAKFIDWVNSVLEFHKGPIIKKFKLGGCLGKKSASHIDSWISAALAKNVETLELDLGSFSYKFPPKKYTFPFALFSGERATCVKNLTLGSCRISPQQPFDCFKSLITLSLKEFLPTSDVINNILSHCPLLEHFYLTEIETLVSLKVTHLRLKYLEVYDCYPLRDMDIQAPNLISLKYQGPHVELSIKCGVQLVDVQYMSHPTEESRVTYLSRQFIPYFSQLKTLTFQCCPDEVELSFLKTLSTLSNLTELVIFLLRGVSPGIPYTFFLQMAPSLRRLEIHFSGESGDSMGIWNLEGTNWEQNVYEDVPHQFLKEVLLSGFEGCLTDMELSMYLLQNCVALEKFTIDRHERTLFITDWIFEEPEEFLDARECAELFSGKKPPHVLMSIL